MKPVAFHPEAEQELDDAIAYYEGQRPGLGADLRAEVERVVEIIRRDPQRCPPYKDSDCRKHMLRRFPYNIFYAELEDRIWIAAVAHQKRRPGYWAGRIPG